MLHMICGISYAAYDMLHVNDNYDNSQQIFKLYLLRTKKTGFNSCAFILLNVRTFFWQFFTMTRLRRYWWPKINLNMLKWFTMVQTIGGNERYDSFPVHFRKNALRKIYPKKILLHQTIRRENSGGLPLVDLGRILLL